MLEPLALLRARLLLDAELASAVEQEVFPERS
jgi:hypothetical protein